MMISPGGEPVPTHNDARLVVKNDHRPNPRDRRRVKIAIDVEAGRNVCGTCRRDTTCPDQYCAGNTAAHASRSSCASNSAYFIRRSGDETLTRGVIRALEFPRSIDFLFSAEKAFLNRVNSRDSSPFRFKSKASAGLAQ